MGWLTGEQERCYIARELREWYPGATYHIMQRGVRRKEIFADQNDYYMFLSMLVKELERYQCKLHAYFGKNAVFRYRQFVEDIGHKYVVEENEIKRSMGEDELWLPW